MRTVGLVAAIVLPFFNIPLIVRVIQRRSSQDISLVWAVGVWVCIIAMFPSSITSADPIMVAYSIVNTIFFTATAAVIIYFHPLTGAGSRRLARSTPSKESPSV